MTDDDTPPIYLDVLAPVSQVAIAEALKLVAAARGALVVGSEEALRTYDTEVDRITKLTLIDPVEKIPFRLAWTLHGLATVAAAAASVAAMASGKDAVAVDQMIQDSITEAFERRQREPAG